MPVKSQAEWTTIRKEYEKGTTLIKDIAAEWDVSTEAIRKHAKNESWLDPREIKKRGKAKLIKRREASLESEAERWADAYQNAREDLLVAARSAIGQFRQDVEDGKLSIKGWRDLPHLLAVLEKAVGETQEQTKPEVVLGYNVAVLTGRAHQPRDLTPAEWEEEHEAKGAAILEVEV